MIGALKKYYLCGIAFQTELGHTDEIDIFESVDALKAKHTCWEECGIVEIEVEEGKKPEQWFSRLWIHGQNFKWGKD